MNELFFENDRMTSYIGLIRLPTAKERCGKDCFIRQRAKSFGSSIGHDTISMSPVSKSLSNGTDTQVGSTGNPMDCRAALSRRPRSRRDLCWDGKWWERGKVENWSFRYPGFTYKVRNQIGIIAFSQHPGMGDTGIARANAVGQP